MSEITDIPLAPLAARVVERMRTLILTVGIGGGGLAAARLLGLGVTDPATIAGAVAVGVPTLALFLCAVFDPRFHNALSVVNADRRERARAKREQRVGSRMLHTATIVLLPCVLFAGLRHDGPAAALAFAAFNLVLLGNIADLTRGQPTDRFVV